MTNARFIAIKILNRFYNREQKLEDIFAEYMAQVGLLKPYKSTFPSVSGRPISSEPEQTRLDGGLNRPYHIETQGLALVADRHLIAEIIYGVVRWQIWLDYILQNYIDLAKTHTAIINILRVTFYQILFLNRVPDYACCHGAVELVKVFYKKQHLPLSRLVNGVLRSFIRDKSKRNFLPQTDDIIFNFEKIYSHPQWIVKRLVAQYGIARTEKILNSNNLRPRLTIRINQTGTPGNATTTSQVINELQSNNINIFLNLSKTNSIILDAKISAVKRLSLWKDGAIYIQDISSTLCAMLCCPEENDLIFDLCAAPGGKTFVLSEMLAQGRTMASHWPHKPASAPNGQASASGRANLVVCNDIDANRLERCKENAARMRYENIEFTNFNMLEFDYPAKANIVLIDAPCSGLGTIRKNSDIKYLKTEEKLLHNIALQRQMLSKANKLLKDGGHLIYSICSIDKDEGENNIKWLLENDKRWVLEDAKDFVGAEFTERQYLSTATLLGEGICDGAFAARLRFEP